MTPWAKNALDVWMGPSRDRRWWRPAHAIYHFQGFPGVTEYEKRQIIWRCAKKINLSCPAKIWWQNIDLIRSREEEAFYPPTPTSKFRLRLLSQRGLSKARQLIQEKYEKKRMDFVRRMQLREIGSLIRKIEEKSRGQYRSNP